MNTEMRVDQQRARQLFENLNSVRQRVKNINKSGKNIRIIAVSKLKPATDILALHQPFSSITSSSTKPHQSQSQPQTHFGENYFQELSEKAALLPRSIRWHFIGGLQTNKCKPLAETVPNLWCVSSVDSVKKANALDRGRELCLLNQREGGGGKGGKEGKVNDDNGNDEEKEEGGKDGEKTSIDPAKISRRGGEEDKDKRERLRVMVQVNTSGEESKSGCDGDATVNLCRHILNNCPNLRLQGLMTIGAIARSLTAASENEDFSCLRKVRDRVVTELGITDKSRLELSMGMSNDFESAVTMGSDEIRIGSTIFGERPPKNEAKVLEDTSEEKS